MSSSSSLQQFQSLCARSRPFLDHKGSVSSTSTWRRGSSTRRSMLLRVCVHLQFHCTHQQLLQHAALLPRAHQIQTETAFREHGKFPGGQKEKLWREFFTDPSQWWDHRPEKANERYPDFKHKKTGEALWLEDRQNPPWVAAEIAAMAPGTVQLNIFAWNQKFSKYAKDGKLEKVIQLFQQMQLEGISPDKFTFVPVIKACAGLGALEDGRLVHKQLIQSGFESDVFVGSSLVDMYAKCGSIKDAWRVFNKMPSRNVVTWNAMVLGHVKCGQGQKALELFQQMQQEGVQPNSVTFVGVLNACASMIALEEGRCVHQHIIRCGWDSDVFVGSSLVDMYAKCGSMEDAWSVFNKMPSRDVVTWTAMILGYVQCRQGQKALELFQQMQQEGVRPDSVTFVAVLNACASVIALEEGRSVHVQIIQNGLDSEVFVGSSLVDMYAKCGSIEEACRVFSKMPSRDVVTWNAMLLGHVKCGQGQKALELFRQMQQEGVQPDSATFVAALNACASVAALEEGRCIHNQIIQSCLELDVFVGSSLVDMYAKCGNIEDAWTVFNKMPSRNVVTWTAMVLGHVKCGQGQKALELFQQMQQEGVQPNSVTFVGVLNACASMIALEEGRCVHQHIIRCGWDSDVFVGSSLVDMYAKCGSMEDAWSVFNKMPSRDVVTWTTILGGCAMHGHDIYAAGGNKHLCQTIEQQRKEKGVKKQPGRTWIEVNNEVHTFVVDDQDHPQMPEIHAELQRLSGHMHDAGYRTCKKFIMHDVDEEEKVFRLCHHSEKLAIAFGLINSAPGTPLRIRKNLRVCEDCHTSTKFISKIAGRTIMVRDANRFHHFEDGVCSCRDYW
ncbi:hypothetical protein BDL97_07G123400 [Sphagnum fallax]|nr:hypothetical protein BDL97_07G123400 [Sphagnum fallax]